MRRARPRRTSHARLTYDPSVNQDAFFSLLTSCSVAVDISSTDHDLTTLGSFGFARRIFCGTGGTLVLKRRDGVAVTYTNVPDGSYIDGAITTVVRSGTTCANMVAEA